MAHSLWRDLLAYRFDVPETETAAEALRKFRDGTAGLLEPERGDLVGFDFSASPSFGQNAAAYLVQHLRGLAGQGPVVVLLEGLRWVDDSPPDLQAQVVDRLPIAPLLIEGAARPELLERRPNWGEGQEACSRLELRPLSMRASRAPVLEILQKVPDVPEAVQQLVVERAKRNPFYAEELVTTLIEDGAFGRATACAVAKAAPPRPRRRMAGAHQARLQSLVRDDDDRLSETGGREPDTDDRARAARGAERAVRPLWPLGVQPGAPHRGRRGDRRGDHPGRLPARVAAVRPIPR